VGLSQSPKKSEKVSVGDDGRDIGRLLRLTDQQAHEEGLHVQAIHLVIAVDGEFETITGSLFGTKGSLCEAIE